MKRMHVAVIMSICFMTLQARNHKKNSDDSKISFEQPIAKAPIKSELKTVDNKIDIEKPTTISPAKLLESIQQELRDPNYRQDILPNNFSYPIQLLQYGNRTNQPREYAQNVLSLFSKLLKGAEYVNSYVFCSFIEQLPGLIKNHFMYFKPGSPTEQLALNDLDILDRLQQTVTSMMYGKFTNEFSTFKENPEKFLDDLTKNIVSATEEEMSIEQLRQTTIRFLEVGLSKLIWNALDHDKSWQSVKMLSDRIATLMEFNIIDDLNDLDELFWTLTHRYCYFLDLNSTELPISFYEKVKQDISTQRLVLFDLEEQETFIQSKSECLMHTLLKQEAKKRAYDYPASSATVA